MADFERIGAQLVLEGLGTFNAGLSAANRSMVAFGGGVGSVGNTLNNASRNLQNFGSNITNVGNFLQRTGFILSFQLTAPLVAFGKSVVSAATDFEDSFAGVRKTVDATEEEFAVLSRQLRDLALVIPIDVNELNRIAEAAGQVGIAKEDIVEFTRTVADLTVTTNLGADATQDLARIANITGTKDFSNLGSAIVDLGNKYAATESEIVQMSLRLAGAGTTIGLTTPEILGLATALSSVGIRAEAGGSAFSRVMIEMFQAVTDGGDALQNFARVAGVSADTFAAKFSTVPREAITLFVEGLARIQEEGGNVFETLGDLELGEIRVRDALLRTANAGDLVASAFANGNKAWEENTALTIEAEERYKTATKQLQLLKNEIVDVAIDLGNIFLPRIVEQAKKFTDEIVNLAKRFQELDETTQNNIVSFGLFLAVLPPILIAGGALASLFGLLVQSIALAGKAVGTFITIAGGLPGTLAKLTTLITGLVSAIGHAGLTGGFTYVLGAAATAMTGFVLAAGGIGLLVAALATDFGGIRGTIVGLHEQLAVILPAAFQKAKDTITGAVRSLVDTVKQSFSDFISNVTGLIQGLTTFRENFFEIFGFIQGMLARWVVDSIGNIIEFGRQIETTFNNWVDQTLAAVNRWLVQAVQAVINFVTQTPAHIHNWVSQTLADFRAWGEEALQAIIEFITQSPAHIHNWISQTHADFKAWANDAINIFLDSVAGFIQAGQDIMNGLAQGIRDGISGALNAIGEAKDSIISGALKGFEESSPSKVFSRIGIGLMEGLEVGIEKAIDAPVQAIRRAVSEVVHAAVEAVEEGSEVIAQSLGSMISDFLGARQALDDWNASIEEMIASGNMEEAAEQFVALGASAEDAVKSVVDIFDRVEKARADAAEKAQREQERAEEEQRRKDEQAAQEAERAALERAARLGDILRDFAQRAGTSFADLMSRGLREFVRQEEVDRISEQINQLARQVQDAWRDGTDAEALIREQETLFAKFVELVQRNVVEELKTKFQLIGEDMGHAVNVGLIAAQNQLERFSDEASKLTKQATDTTATYVANIARQAQHEWNIKLGEMQAQLEKFKREATNIADIATRQGDIANERNTAERNSRATNWFQTVLSDEQRRRLVGLGVTVEDIVEIWQNAMFGGMGIVGAITDAFPNTFPEWGNGVSAVQTPSNPSVPTNASTTTNFNVTANYTQPQEPQSILLDMQTIAMQMGT